MKLNGSNGARAVCALNLKTVMKHAREGQLNVQNWETFIGVPGSVFSLPFILYKQAMEWYWQEEKKVGDERHAAPYRATPNWSLNDANATSTSNDDTRAYLLTLKSEKPGASKISMTSISKMMTPNAYLKHNVNPKENFCSSYEK